MARKTERILTICWYLRNNWLSATQLIGICGVPERTIFRDLKELQDLSIILKSDTLYTLNQSWAPATNGNNP